MQHAQRTALRRGDEYIRTGALGRVALPARGEQPAEPDRISKGYGPAPSRLRLLLGPAPKRPSTWRGVVPALVLDYGRRIRNDGVHGDYARRALSAAFEGEKRTLPDWPVAVSPAAASWCSTTPRSGRTR